jgi:hypothetical protein
MISDDDHEACHAAGLAGPWRRRATVSPALLGHAGRAPASLARPVESRPRGWHDDRISRSP